MDPRDVVFVKGVVEASDGLASIFAEPRARGAAPVGGDLLVACHASRAAELRELLDDLGCKARRRGDDERALDDDGHSEAIAAPESAEVDDVR